MTTQKQANKGVLLDVQTHEDEGLSVVDLFIRPMGPAGGIIRLQDRDFPPYYYIQLVPSADPSKILSKMKEETLPGGLVPLRVERVERDKRSFLKLTFKTINELVRSRDLIKNYPFVEALYESNIPYTKRYLLDKQLIPYTLTEWVLTKEGHVKSIQSTEGETPSLRTGSLDIETYGTHKVPIPEKDPIISVALNTPVGKKVFIAAEYQNEFTHPCMNEKKVLEQTSTFLALADLDVLYTYNGDHFDFPFLVERSKRNMVKMDYGFGDVQLVGKGNEREARIHGMQHVDVYQLMRLLARFQVIKSPRMDLESVMRAVFGKGEKSLTHAQIVETWKTQKGLDALAKYNLTDTEYTQELGDEFLPSLLEIARLVHLTLFEVNRMTASQLVETTLMNESVKQGKMFPNSPSDEQVRARETSPIEGGYVKEPVAGLHENLAVLDFRSLHPSIMISHNISPDTLDCEHTACKEGVNHSPTGHWFCTKKKGLFSTVLERILDARIAVQSQMDETKKGDPKLVFLKARKQALKIVLNSFFGTLAYSRFRWYSRESARAITAWSRHYIRQTLNWAEEDGFNPVYGDSITSERFVTVRNPDGLIEIKNIESFFNENIDTFPAVSRGKEFVQPTGYCALSINPKTRIAEWKPIRNIVRHQTKKKIYRITQKFGETRVTEDHSIIVDSEKGFKEIKPVEMDRHSFIKARITIQEKKIATIDLYPLVKNYTHQTVYKGRTKVSRWKTDDVCMWFNWTNQTKPVKIKRHIQVESPEFEALCRLLGAYISEGSSSTPETTATRLGASIASSNREWLQSLQKDYSLLFDREAGIVASMTGPRSLTYKVGRSLRQVQYVDSTHKLQMMNAAAAVFFKTLCGQRSEGKILPSFIFNVPEKYQRILLEKMIEGDGSHSVNKKLGYSKEYVAKNFAYTTKSLGVASGLTFLLNLLGITHSIQYRPAKKCYTIKTSTAHNKRIKTKIVEEPYSGYVYDLTVEENNNFVDSCGQVLLHNTDSAFILLPGKKTEEDVKKFVQKVNTKLPGRMELEFEGLYKRGIFVTKKEGHAAKKRYALADYENNLTIVGFEYVRRDVSVIARETQKKVLEEILVKGNPKKAHDIVLEAIKRLRAGKVPKKELVILTQLQRKPESYAAMAPHVSAAQKAQKRGKEIPVGSMLGFIITKNGKSISDKAELEEFVKEGDYDADYYIKNQVIPAVEKIFAELGIDSTDLERGGKQTGLSSFM